MLAISNTGKTINMYLDREAHAVIADNERVGVTYDSNENVLILRPDPTGRKISRAEVEGKYRISIPSGSVPNLPKFSRVQFDTTPSENGMVSLKLNRNLEAPKIRKSPVKYKKGESRRILESSKKVETIVKELEATLPNLAIKTSTGKSLAFKLPDDKLLDLCLELVHAGYAI